MDAASTERPITGGRSAAGPSAGLAWTADWRIGPAEADEPGSAAIPLLRLTPVREWPAARPPSSRAVRTAVTGAGVLVITAGLGRRAGAPARLTALCSAGACAVVVGPWLASRVVPRTAAH